MMNYFPIPPIYPDRYGMFGVSGRSKGYQISLLDDYSGTAGHIIKGHSMGGSLFLYKKKNDLYSS